MKRRKTVWLAALAAMMLVGCSLVGGTQQTDEASAGAKQEDSFRVYYKTAQGDALVSLPYQVKAQTFDEILDELLAQFKEAPTEEEISALPSSVTVDSYTRGVDNLTVDFGSGYLGLSGADQVLLQAAMVKTLVQLPGVAKVYITVAGQPVTNEAGSPIGPMDDDSFIASGAEGIGSVRTMTLKLYFGARDGAGIAPETQSVRYSSNLSLEKVIVEEIIGGPEGEELLPVVSPDTKVEAVKTDGQNCLVGLDAAFGQEMEGVSPEMTIYAFVNAICETCDVEGVRFQIGGRSDVRFRDQINLDQTFFRDLSLVESVPLAEGEDGSAAREPESRKETEQKTASEDTAAAGAPSIGVDPSLIEGET